MPLKIEAIDIESNKIQLHITNEPNCCPLCDRKQVSLFVSAFQSEDDRCQIVYRCTNNECLSFYIAYYHKTHTEFKTDYDEYKLIKTRPQNYKDIVFEKEIRRLSPSYCEIFQEATFAEMRDYKQIAGVGYRKSLEFLIKDFCIRKNPTKKTEIKKSWLMDCIKKYIADPTIQKCAERATWLGNDETHYVRKWKGKDINDLKSLIQLTKNWMLTNIQTDKYMKSMKSKKP